MHIFNAFKKKLTKQEFIKPKKIFSVDVKTFKDKIFSIHI